MVEPRVPEVYPLLPEEAAPGELVPEVWENYLEPEELEDWLEESFPG